MGRTGDMATESCYLTDRSSIAAGPGSDRGISGGKKAKYLNFFVAGIIFVVGLGAVALTVYSAKTRKGAGPIFATIADLTTRSHAKSRSAHERSFAPAIDRARCTPRTFKPRKNPTSDCAPGEALERTRT